MQVIKRDGKEVLFNPTKIVNAINKAMISAYGEIYETDTAEEIAKLIGETNTTLSVEQIQDLVEEYLMKSEYPEVARAYIIYREQRSKERSKKSKLIKAVMKRINASEAENANANVDEKSFSGREKEASSDVQKIIALDYVLSPEISAAHQNMLLYQHDLEKTNIGEHNCFGRETQFITIDGVKSFYDFEDGDKVIVLTHKGNWKPATVKSYGIQNLSNFTFKNGRFETTVRATDNHRWILQDGTETTSLSIGDRLIKPPVLFNDSLLEPDFYKNFSPEEVRYWCMGFALGDGTVEYNTSKIDQHNYKANRTRIRLCGEKDKKYLEAFEYGGASIRSQIAENGDRFVCVLNYHKEIPTFETLTQLRLFIAGLYSADGTISARSCTGKMMHNLLTSNETIMAFIEQYADVVGLYRTTSTDKTNQKTNFGTRGLTKVFNFNPNPSFSYRLINKQPDSEEEVWCLEVEDDASFILAHGIPTGNCLNIDFEKLLHEGFRTRNGDIRPPSTFSTACQQIAVIFQCQSQIQFGGAGSVHIDFDLKPFVKKSFYKYMLYYFTDVENLDEEEALSILKTHEPIEIDNEKLQKEMSKAYTYALKSLEREGRQSAEALFHNLNTLESRAGSQVPFTSINYGRDESTEGRLVSKWLLNASLNGIGKHHLTPIFPISIFQYKNGCNANPEDKNYDLKQLAIKSLSKRIYPNFVNCDWSEAHENPLDPDTFFSTMGCRTMLGYDRFSNSYNRVGRGNLVPNTMILPKLGIEYGTCLGQRKKPDLKGFWSAFEDLLMLCEQGLLERFDIMVHQTPEAAPFMYQNGTMKDSQNCQLSTYEALKHCTLAIGYIGIAEMCQALFGKNHAEDKEVHKFALEVVKRINDFAKEASERNNLNFSCYATPAEGLCHTAAKALRKQYGIIPKVTDRDFITNSHHCPVWQKVGIFEKLEIEAPFCKYPTGGCITYIELDSTFMNNTKAVEQVIDYAFKKLDIPYLAFNFPIDSCLDCGYQSEFNDSCPECGSHNIQQLRRVTGYLSSDYRNFNKGKQAEVEARFKHSLNGSEKND